MMPFAGYHKCAVKCLVIAYIHLDELWGFAAYGWYSAIEIIKTNDKVLNLVYTLLWFGHMY